MRACMADAACDDVKDELQHSQACYEALLESHNALEVRQVVSQAPVSVAMLLPISNLAKLESRDFERTLLAAAPGVCVKNRFGADDLTTIKGITPKIEVWLGLNGITRFADIASLRASELYWLVENSPYDGASVYRDQWVAQAAGLAAKV